jgi:hypothetical protein
MNFSLSTPSIHGVPVKGAHRANIDFQTTNLVYEIVGLLSKVKGIPSIVDIAFYKNQVFIRFEHPLGDVTPGIEVYLDPAHPDKWFFKTVEGKGDQEGQTPGGKWTPLAYELLKDKVTGMSKNNKAGLKFDLDVDNFDLNEMIVAINEGQQAFSDVLASRELAS